MPVELVLHVRRFFCDTPVCERTTFTERLPAVAPLYGNTHFVQRRNSFMLLFKF